MKTAPEQPGLVGRANRKRLAGLALALSCGLSGCGREFYRNWTDQDVSHVVFEKSRDPRWRLDLFSIEPPALSRFANPYDPDRPPAPPDDRAAEALSPVPQWPHHRLLVPAESTGYLDLMEKWMRQRPAEPTTGPPPEAVAPRRPPSVVPAPPEALRSPPPPDSSVPPFQPEAAPPAGMPATPPADGAAPGILPMPENGTNSGSPSAARPPKINGPARPPSRPSLPATANAIRPRPTPPAPGRPRSQDNGVQLTAFQVPETVPPAPVDTPETPAAPAPGTRQPGDARDLNADTDPNPDVNIDLERPPGAVPGGDEAARRSAEGLSRLLSPQIEPISDYEAAALEPGTSIYKINPVQALTLALMNSRAYQGRLESVYIRAMDVTLARFQLQPQFYAGLSPSTAPSGPNGRSAGIAPPNPQNSFTYRTREAIGGQTSTLSLGTAAGFGKVLSFGGAIAAGFSNQVLFNFTGTNPVQPTVNSFLPIVFNQPFLRGGGRAVTLEPLTLAERNMLYEVRALARFRQEFMPAVLASNLNTTGAGQTAAPIVAGGTTDGVGGAGGGGVGGGGGGNGYLGVLNQYQQVENGRKNVAAYESLLEAYTQMAEGAGANISQLNVDQIAQSLEQQRISLIQATTSLRIALDTYKTQLGLPPDLPLVLDRELLAGFNDVFQQINDWFTDENRDPADLERFVEQLPSLEDVVIDGRKVVEMGRDSRQQENMLLAAERVALENRFDLMNARAQLYDQWRQLAVRFNAVKGIFNVTVTNQIQTPPTTTNPFAFSDQAKNFSLVLNTELPLIRVNERNQYRLGLIALQQSQRGLMAQEDGIKLTVRTDIRNLINFGEQYERQRRLLVVSLQQRDNAARTIFAPPGAGGQGSDPTAQTQQLVTGLNQTLQSQNSLVQLWVNYQSNRLALYRDIGIMPYDEWEAYHEFFPVNTRPARRGAGAGGLTPAGAPGAAAGRP